MTKLYEIVLEKNV